MAKLLTPFWVEHKDESKGEIPSPGALPKLGLFGAGAVGVGYLAHKTIGLQKGFDYLTQGVRAAEFLTPAFMGRTFRLSEALSPFETAKEFSWSAHHFKQPNFQKYISKLTGLSLDELVKAGAHQGLTFIPDKANTGRLVSKSGNLIKSNVSLLRYEQLKASLGNWYARTFGIDFQENLLGGVDKKVGEASYRAPKFLPIEAVSANTRSRVRYAQGIAAQVVGRFNTLLSDPFENEYLGKIVKNVPILERLNFSVKPGTASKMLGRYTMKAMALGGVLTGLQYFDYRRREGNRALVIPEMALYGGLTALALAPKKSSLKAYGLYGAAIGGMVGLFPTFNKGIFSGIGNLWAGLNLTRAGFSDALGLTEAVKSQEEYLPGSTKLTTAMGFVGAGGLYAGIGQYVRRLGLTARLAARGRGLARGTQEAQRFLSILPSLQAAKFQRGIGSKLPRGLSNVLASVISSKWHTRGAAVGGVAYGAFSALGALSAGSPLSAATFAAGTALGLYGLSLRETVPSTLKHMSGTRLSKRGMLFAAAGLALPFLLRSRESAGDLYDTYSGKTDVPVMKSRWWPANRSPWEGQRPLYYRKHWVQAIGDGSKEIALYGSEQAYWDTHPLTSPLNYLRDPYAQEKMMWARGYKFPVTGQAFEEVPILGPLLSETLGKLVKPRKMMAPEEWLGANRPTLGFSAVGEGYLYQPGPTSERGILPDRAGYPVPDRQGLGYGLSMQEHYMKELVGLPGFVTESFQEALFGSKLIGGEDKTYLASATQLSGLNRWYYDWNLGGGFGLTTEAVRRFIPKDPGFDYYNPFKTKMPAWLPGDDAGYFLNFKSAEIFNQIAEPWRRLPGEGWIAANPEWAEEGLVDEETPLGQYPVSARYKITANVAPWSRAAAGMRAHLTRVMRSSPESLTPFEYSQIRQTDEQLLAMKTKRTFSPDVTSEAGLEPMELRVKGVLPGGLLQTDIGPLSLAGVSMTGAQLSRQAIREDNSITIQEAERRASIRAQEIGSFVKEYVSPGDRITAYVNKQLGSRYLKEDSGITVPAVVMAGSTNLNQALLDEGITSQFGVNDNALAFRGVYGFDTPLRNAWDLVTHAMDTPFEALTPLAPAAKFIHRNTAVEDYARNQVYGREIALWQHPYEHFIKPFFSRLTGILPESEQKQRDIEEYFDKLKYAKYRALEETATDPRLKSEYKRQMGRTMVGINPFSPYIFSKSAFPAEVRPYIDSFLNESNPEERKRILQTVAPDVGRAIQGKWMAQELEGLKAKGQVSSLSFGESRRLSELEDMGRRETFEGQQRRDAEVAEYFKSHKLPDADFVGWYGQADLEDFKLAYVNQEGENHHDYGLWEDQKRSLLRKPYVANELEEIDPFSSELNVGNPFMDLRASLRSRHIGSVQFDYGSSMLHAGHLEVNTEEDIDTNMIHAVNEGLL